MVTSNQRNTPALFNFWLNKALLWFWIQRLLCNIECKRFSICLAMLAINRILQLIFDSIWHPYSPSLQGVNIYQKLIKRTELNSFVFIFSNKFSQNINLFIAEYTLILQKISPICEIYPFKLIRYKSLERIKFALLALVIK